MLSVPIDPAHAAALLVAVALAMFRIELDSPNVTTLGPIPKNVYQVVMPFPSVKRPSRISAEISHIDPYRPRRSLGPTPTPMMNDYSLIM